MLRHVLFTTKVSALVFEILLNEFKASCLFKHTITLFFVFSGPLSHVENELAPPGE
jgi:hypothetical protein